MRCMYIDIFGDGAHGGAGLLSLLHIFFGGGAGAFGGGAIASCGLRCQ